MIAITWATFFVGALISFFFQVGGARRPGSVIDFAKHCFPIDGWKSRSNIIDIIMYVVSKLAGGLFALGEIALTTAASLGIASVLAALFPAHVAGNITIPWIVGVALAMFLAMDFANYLTHYWQHKIGFLWELHKVHHSATFLTPLTTKRMHPLGDKLDRFVSGLLTAIPGGVAMHHFGLSVVEMLLLAATANRLGAILVLDALRHTHFPISFGWANRVIMSPHMHQLHHSTKYEHWDKNLGNKLSIWDWMFGTACLPEKGEKLNFGIGRGGAADAEYVTVYGAYVHPVVRMVKMLLGRIQPVYGRPDLTIDNADEPAPRRRDVQPTPAE